VNFFKQLLGNGLLKRNRPDKGVLIALFPIKEAARALRVSLNYNNGQILQFEPLSYGG
jgi:hypothetical protein